MRNYGDTCPIAAQAAQGALALVRTSGQGTLKLLAPVFSRPQALLDAQGNTIVYGWIHDSAGSPIDEVLVSVYRTPHSYTGEDGADISCHGGSAAVKMLLLTLRKAGFEDALPGEFTFRAFMNGKLDLTRSESVMELVSAKTKEGLEHAVKRLSGVLEREIKTIRDTLLEAVSAAELYLDYPEEEIDEDPGSFSYSETAEDALRRLRVLASSYDRERLYQEGALTVIAGRPNAGKSSLFNALLNEDRSIVTDTPGTTRDWIETSLTIEGIPLRLTDTAGLRDPSSCPSGTDEAEMLGIQRSRELTEEADIILYIVDACEGFQKEDEKFLTEVSVPFLILVWNKIDLIEHEIASRAPIIAEILQLPPRSFAIVPVSARTGKGLEELSASIAGLLIQKASYSSAADTLPEGSPGLGTLRQKELIEKAVVLLEDALSMTARNEPLDLISPLLRESLNALGEITGEISSAGILETMFSRFCLGK
ncbi:MAG: tRNA uridine-5-carboxymethylaminomethyl(34) synthesis GTPase MnmE [Treponema sp.]|nr:tRNA uridine-5-carboxymethylaminomethyl(34) synthesis GTPase MnmE [Treponema sp.]